MSINSLVNELRSKVDLLRKHASDFERANTETSVRDAARRIREDTASIERLVKNCTSECASAESKKINEIRTPSS